MKEDPVAKGTTDPATVEAETKAQNANGLGGLTDKEWDGKAPDAPVEGQTGFYRDPDEDAPEEKEKSKAPFSDLNPPAEIEAISVTAQMLSGRTRTTGYVTFEFPWPEVLRLHAGFSKSLELRFAERTISGASVDTISSHPDADGAIRAKVQFVVPETKREDLMDFLKATTKIGTLEIEPNQMSLDSLLTHNSRDDEEPGDAEAADGDA